MIKNWYNTILISAIIIASPTQASEPLWITESTSTDEIVAALRLPSNPNEIYRDIVDIVDKHPKIKRFVKATDAEKKGICTCHFFVISRNPRLVLALISLV